MTFIGVLMTSCFNRFHEICKKAPVRETFLIKSFNFTEEGLHCRWCPMNLHKYPQGTGPNLNFHMLFPWRPGLNMNIFCIFNLKRVSNGNVSWILCLYFRNVLSFLMIMQICLLESSLRCVWKWWKPFETIIKKSCSLRWCPRKF